LVGRKMAGRLVENGFAASSGVSKSAKVVLVCVTAAHRRWRAARARTVARRETSPGE
jgi:hypothetical protein